MRYEFHSHTFLSDGELHPVELVRRARAAGHASIAVTDHVGLHDAADVVPRLARDLETLAADWGIVALPGVELTHLPPRRIAAAARAARRAGAKIVVVHGETRDEPVLPGTNAAAARCADVDVLAHPGFLSERDARTAADTGVFLEITAKRAHMATNGHVARLIERVGAPFVVNGDVHAPHQLLDEGRARETASGAGLPARLVERGLGSFPRALLRRRA